MKVTSLAAALIAVAVGMVGVCDLSNAATLASWTFEPPFADLTNSATIGSINPAVGTGTASGVHASADTDWSTPSGNGSTDSMSSNTWAINDYLQFTTSTGGNSNITFSWDQTSSGTGPKDFSLSYSTDGSTFTPVTTYAVLANASPNPVWNSATASPLYSYSAGVTGISASSIYFRLTNTTTVSANGGTVAAGGTSRVDNVAIAGVPEPSTLALGGIALVAALASRRRA
ncbi:MAG: hypothetical protein C0485_07145 [Pirellula sp.]|nr:hypothetical protein [Pirellula sp.]